MEPKFQTSFIPKNPVVAGQGASIPYTRERNLFSTVSAVFFVLTLLIAGGLFGYKIILNNKISAADAELVAARATLDPEKIKELIDANSRIVSVKNLLNKHVVLSELLILLQQATVKKVRYDSLSYKNVEGKLSISMESQAASYNAIAAQESLFAKSEFIKNSNFYNFSLSQNGNIKLSITAELVPKLISYKDILANLSPDTVTSSTTSTTTATTTSP